MHDPMSVKRVDTSVKRVDTRVASYEMGGSGGDIVTVGRAKLRNDDNKGGNGLHRRS